MRDVWLNWRRQLVQLGHALLLIQPQQWEESAAVLSRVGDWQNGESSLVVCLTTCVIDGAPEAVAVNQRDRVVAVEQWAQPALRCVLQMPEQVLPLIAPCVETKTAILG